MTAEQVLTVVEYLGVGNSIVHNISAAEAFRKFDWLTHSPVLNRVGDLRGMVLNARARTVFGVTGKLSAISKVAENVQLVIKIADEAGKSWPQIQEIIDSKDDPSVKFGKLSAQAAGICSRVLVKTGTGTVNATTWVMRTAKHINPIWWTAEAMKPFTGGVNRSDEAMDQMDTWMAQVERSATYAYDGKNFYSFIVSAVSH